MHSRLIILATIVFCGCEAQKPKPQKFKDPIAAKADAVKASPIPRNSPSDVAPNTNWYARDVSGGALDDLLGTQPLPTRPGGNYIVTNVEGGNVTYHFNDLKASSATLPMSQFLNKFYRILP